MKIKDEQPPISPKDTWKGTAFLIKAMQKDTLKRTIEMKGNRNSGKIYRKSTLWPLRPLIRTLSAMKSFR